MSRPKKLVPLVDKIAQAFAAVERLQRKGSHPRGFRYTRAHDVFEIVRAKLLDRGVIVCPVEGVPVYVERQTNGGELQTECRLQVTYVFQDAKEKLDPPLVINGCGRSVGEEALEIAQTKAQKALLKRFGIMADEQDDAPQPAGEAEANPHDGHDERSVPVDEKPVTHAQIRVFNEACKESGKTPEQILHYLFDTHSVAALHNLSRGKAFTQAMKWAKSGATLAPKPQAAPAIQATLPLPKQAPPIEMRIGNKSIEFEPKKTAYSL